MTPHEFRNKWRNVELKERTASQSHFNDLCALLDIVDPITADPKGEFFTFEKGAKKTGGGDGWADVWRKGCFAWEYKGKHKDLAKAHAQLLQYASALENPPLLIVSDMDRILIHTNWTNSVSKTYEITIEDILDAGKRDILKAAFLDPDKLKPTTTRQKLTEEAATTFAALAQRLRERGHVPHEVAHFLIRLVFCLFAEDAGLLPDHLFQKLLTMCRHKPQNFKPNVAMLFAAMRDQGGSVGFDPIEWFNGGLFDDDTALDLEKDDIAMLLAASKLDWSEIDASILGTLFERGLDPAKRSQLGAHYTDRDKIMMILEPVIIRPLETEWAQVHSVIAGYVAEADKADAAIKAIAAQAAKEMIEAPDQLKANEPARRAKTAKLKKEMDAALLAAGEAKAVFLERLKAFRVLDPACGSGNFLNLALYALKDIEHRVNIEAETLGLPRVAPQVGPENMLGIELNLYAAELARVSVWIGEIQWMRKNGFEANRNPILRTLDTIECRDAVLAPDGTRAVWPKADVVVGNPPYLGAKRMFRDLGRTETLQLRSAYPEMSGFTDLVCYWFRLGIQSIVENKQVRVGFVSTSKIARNTNLPVMRTIVSNGQIFDAWSDLEWVIDGALVRVAIVCFSGNDDLAVARLDGNIVGLINPDLTAGTSTSNAIRLKENKSLAFVGAQKSGPFDISCETARVWLKQPLNPNLRPNSDVLKRTLNGNELGTVRSETWLIDFPRGLDEPEAANWEVPFQHLINTTYDPESSEFIGLKDFRSKVRDSQPKEEWWTLYWPRPVLRNAVAPLSRFVATQMTSEHRLFVWLDNRILPDNNIIAFAKDDDTFFGIVHSCFHETWSRRIGNRIGVGNQARYNNSTTFETFPFPQGLTPNIPAADYADDPRAIKIATAAARLNELRENWLNPADLVVVVPEVVAGYPDRILPKDEDAAKVLKTRTLTNLYNARPAWLDNAHKVLDEAVAEAYGWGDDWRAGLLGDDEILSRLFALNQERAGK
jgi:type II restriction/modification system DNA methylase subunit YeeA